MRACFWGSGGVPDLRVWKTAAARAYKRRVHARGEADLCEVIYEDVQLWDLQERAVAEGQRCAECGDVIRGMLCHDVAWQTVHWGCRREGF